LDGLATGRLLGPGGSGGVGWLTLAALARARHDGSWRLARTKNRRDARWGSDEAAIPAATISTNFTVKREK
jgi:hypothetical protein